jgi:putative ABC transport system ATP-binding protein
MILEMSNVYKNYIQGNMDVPVLKDINFSVEEGEYVAIMGPSGSGKSTLMNIIGCLDQATSGTYLLDGKAIENYSDKELARVRNEYIGFVFQTFNLLPKQSALDNVALPLQYAGVPKRYRKERCMEALTMVGLEDRVNFKPTQLSGGQKQRVAIARAMINDPKILLADEPTGALDSKSGVQVMELFSQLHKQGKTIIMITHSDEIASHADRVIRIIDGEIYDNDTKIQSGYTEQAVDEEVTV